MDAPKRLKVLLGRLVGTYDHGTFLGHRPQDARSKINRERTHLLTQYLKQTLLFYEKRAETPAVVHSVR